MCPLSRLVLVAREHGHSWQLRDRDRRVRFTPSRPTRWQSRRNPLVIVSGCSGAEPSGVEVNSNPSGSNASRQAAVTDSARAL